MTVFNEISSSADGGITSSSTSSWSSAHSGSGLTLQAGGSAGVLAAGSYVTVPPATYFVSRVYVSYDTAATLSGLGVSSGYLTVKYKAGVYTAGQSLQVYVWTKTGVSAALGTSSFSLVGAAASSPVSMASIVAAGSFGYQIPLNATGLAAVKTSGTAPTRFCLLASNDFNNTTPTLGDLSAGIGLHYIGSAGGSITLTVSTAAPPTYSSITPTSGSTSGGTPFTVTGTGFQSGMAITIGGVAATSVVVGSSTSATGVTGPHPAVGLVSVVLTNTDGGTVTHSNAYTYTSGVPAAVNILPVQGSTAGGTAVTITGTGFASGGSPANGVTFDGVAATSVVVASDTTITCVTPAHAAGAVDVNVINPNTTGNSILVGAYTYYIAPPSTSAGSQLIFDFTRRLWYSASYGHLQSVISLPIGGVPYSLALNTDGAVNYILSDDNSAVNSSTLPIGRGFIQTEPISFGNSKSQKIFVAIRLVVNDVTAIVASGGVTNAWLCYVYIDQNPVPISISLAVNAQPYNRFPSGTVEGTHVGELIGYIHQDSGGVVTGHSIRAEIYFPAGTPANTPTLGTTSSAPNHLPWQLYQIDIVASLVDESKVEP